MTLTDVTEVDADGNPVIPVFSTDSDGNAPTVIGPFTATTNNGLIIPYGSSLTGSGIVGLPTTISGTLEPDPDEEPATLSFTGGNVTLESSANTVILVDGTGTGNGAGNYSRMLVTDGQFIAAGSLTPELLSGYTPAIGTSYNIVNTSGGATGAFASVAQPSGLSSGSRIDVLYTADAINMYVTLNDYTNLSDYGVALSANQMAAGKGVNALRGTPGTRLDNGTTSLLGHLYLDSSSQIPASLNQLSATVYGDAITAQVGAVRDYDLSLADQLGSEAGQDFSQDQRSGFAHGLSFWASGLGGNNTVGADGNTGFTSGIRGKAIGADKYLGGGWRAGLALGNQRVTTNSQATSASAKSDLYQATAYAQWSDKEYYVDGGIGFVSAHSTFDRNMVLLGARAQSSANGTGTNALLDAGAIFKLGLVTLQPQVGINYVLQRQGGVTESGQGGGQLIVNGDSLSGLHSTLGAKLQTTIYDRGGISAKSNLFMTWDHQFSADRVNTTAQFVAAQGTYMDFTSAPIGNENLIGGAGVNVAIGAQWSAYLSGSFHSSSNDRGSTINGGIQYSW